MNRISNAIMTAAIIVFFAFPGFAQQAGSKYNPKLYKKEPVWIQMMQDPEANYFETIKAFRDFWKGYKLPGEPEELEGRDSFEKEVGLEEEGEDEDRDREKKRVRKDKGAGDYSFEVKQFKGWFKDSQPWVQADGHILTQEERQSLIDRQQNQLKSIEKNQKN